jgi:U4/U6 small nuclear ribonucleoprotein PRP31
MSVILVTSSGDVTTMSTMPVTPLLLLHCPRIALTLTLPNVTSPQLNDNNNTHHTHTHTQALPVPDKEKKKKRGGRVARARKKRLGLTDMRRDANRMEFGNQGDEYGDSSMGLTLGMLGKEGSGNVRMTKSEYKLNAKKQQQSGKRKAGGPAGLSSSVVSSAGGGGGGGGVGTAKGLASGLQSSLAFTPVQGMVMADPQANAKRLKEVNQKYFAAHQGFKKR